MHAVDSRLGKKTWHSALLGRVADAIDISEKNSETVSLLMSQSRVVEVCSLHPKPPLSPCFRPK